MFCPLPEDVLAHNYIYNMRISTKTKNGMPNTYSTLLRFFDTCFFTESSSSVSSPSRDIA